MTAARSRYRFQLLAPGTDELGPMFSAGSRNAGLHRAKLDEVQRLRARLYLQDGAIGSELIDQEGRFQIAADNEAWHLLVEDPDGEVIGSARYIVHRNTVIYNRLRISQTPLAQDPAWATHLQRAVQADLRLARQRKNHYVELGGWAISQAWRKTRVAIDVAAASYALCRLWGGAIGSCAATVRHHSAAILKRLGGADFAWDGCSLPSYFDPCFGCQMLLLRFDSLTPSPCIFEAIEEAQMQLAEGPVIYSGSDLAICG